MQGWKTKVIGKRLFISPHTVSRHIRNLSARTGAKNSVHLQVLFSCHDSLHVAHPMLTQRENEIMQWVMEGLDSEEIARVMAIRYATVRKHRENILLKLKVNSIRLAVAVFLAINRNRKEEIIHE